MKYIIEIEDVPFSKVRIDDSGAQNINLYRAKGFNSLVFDNNGLEKLTPLDKAFEEAYQKGLVKGYKDGCETGRNEATTLEYQRGLDDAWECMKAIAFLNKPRDMRDFFGCSTLGGILIDYTASEAIAKIKAYEESQKPDEIKVSDIITDGKINYLVIDITDKSYVALQGTDFETVYIGKDYIKSYHNLHDSKDIRKIAEEMTWLM